MSKYVNLASKIIDLVHAEHKAGLRAERKATAEAKAKKVKELDPSVDSENPGFKDKEQEAIQAKSKEKEESEDDEKEDELVRKEQEEEARLTERLVVVCDIECLIAWRGNETLEEGTETVSFSDTIPKHLYFRSSRRCSWSKPNSFSSKSPGVCMSCARHRRRSPTILRKPC